MNYLNDVYPVAGVVLAWCLSLGTALCIVGLICNVFIRPHADNPYLDLCVEVSIPLSTVFVFGSQAIISGYDYYYSRTVLGVNNYGFLFSCLFAILSFLLIATLLYPVCKVLIPTTIEKIQEQNKQEMRKAEEDTEE